MHTLYHVFIYIYIYIYIVLLPVLLLLLLLLLLPFRKLLADVCQIEILNFSLGMSNLNIEITVPRNAVRRQMPSTVIVIYSVDVTSNLK